MSVITAGQGLLLYSPVAMDAGHINEISRLGRVDAVMAPNLQHHRFLRDAKAAFPDARVLIPQGLAAKIGSFPEAEIMPDNDSLGLSEDLDHHVFSGHAIHETCLFHRPSGTLLTADLIYNLQAEQLWAEKAFFKLIGSYGRPAVPFYHRFAIEDKAAVQHLIDTVERWPIKRIVPCHGRIVEAADAGAIFAGAWRNLG